MMSEIQISLEQQLTNIADLLALAKELKKVSHRLQQTIKDFKIV
jgi:methyl-accepting chemotaxis protein